MARKQTLQLDLELPAEEPPVERVETPAPRRARAKTDARSRWRDGLRPWLIGAGAALIVAAAAWALYWADSFLATGRQFLLASSGLRVDGLQYGPRAAALGVFREDLGRSVYLLPLAERRAALLGIDWVKEASVSRRWPNRLAVRVVERTPVAFVLLPGEQALIDAEGVILKPPAARFDLPVLRGIRREQPAESRRARVRQVSELLREAQAHASQLSEIDVSDPENLVATQTVGGRAVRLMLGNRRYQSRLKTYLAHHDEIARRLPGVSVFDLRLDDRITAVAPPPEPDASPRPPKPPVRPAKAAPIRGGKNVR